MALTPLADGDRVMLAATSIDMWIDMGNEVDEEVLYQVAELWHLQGDDHDLAVLYALLLNLTEMEDIP